MAKFVVYEKVLEIAYKNFFDKNNISNAGQTGVNLGCGLLAGFAAAFVSQPADTMLSKINKTRGLPGESTTSRLVKIAGELGLRGSFGGLGTRLVMIGGITAGQFAIYGKSCSSSQSYSQCRSNRVQVTSKRPSAPQVMLPPAPIPASY